MKIQDVFNAGRRWLAATPERALDAAYRAAIRIEAIENDHFNGKIVSTGSMDYSESVTKVFMSDVSNYLSTINARLAEFRISRGLLIFSNSQPEDSSQGIVRYTNGFDSPRELTILEKLAFIDTVTSRYKNPAPEDIEVTPTRRLEKNQRNNRLIINKNNRSIVLDKSIQEKNGKDPSTETITDKTSVLPRSFMRTLSRIKQEIDPKAEDTEEEVVKKFRKSRNKTAISIRFLLILIIVPLLTHQVTKSLLITPLVENYFADREQILFINQDMEEEAFVELRRYEEKLRFQSMIGIIPPLSEAEEEAQIRIKAEELSEEFRARGINAIGNVFADFFSLLAFAGIVYFCKREIQIIKSFLDEIAYGLSDSAKAFLIILLTDMFVGYHSPHGWEVILEGIARHLGLPENRDFNFLFIATFPVILDTVLKYWIFRYLNRISPSSVATYKNMNE
ncbi:proton extrusion protein PcxA [Pleurocapsales cyanobacterium LEGE 10410]|nr:proton extrusion protein PcxA [Pleurocapsales cyanobacterium LEGE 10410]